LRAVVELLVVLLLAACSERAPSKREDPVVARVGEVELRESDVKRAMARDPGASTSRFEDATAQRELLDGLVRFELLSQAAEREGLTSDPDAIHAMKQIAVTKLVNRALGSAGDPSSISKTDLEHEYARRVAQDFTLPAAARVRHLRVADPERAASLVSRARHLRPDDDAGFAELARRHSEDSATRDAGGDLGFVDEKAQLPLPLRQAVLAMSRVGEIAGPIPTEAGYEVVRLVERRAPAVSPLSSVEEPLRQRLYRERRAKALEAYLSDLRQQTKVEIVKRR
jgi:parvulin-like peptidyl-prolyl isomerase